MRKRHIRKDTVYTINKTHIWRNYEIVYKDQNKNTRTSFPINYKNCKNLARDSVARKSYFRNPKLQSKTNGYN